jgi:heat shock protein HslJ
MTTKQDKQLPYSIGIAVVLIGVLYFLSTHLSGGPKESNVKTVELTPTATENSTVVTDSDHMYLGMKIWTWVKAKGTDGKEVMPSGSKPFTIAFDFNSGKFAITTDCNNGGGVFAAKSGVVQLGAIATTKMACEGSQESVFTGLISAAQTFYFTTKGEMVITTKDGSTVTFK